MVLKCSPYLFVAFSDHLSAYFSPPPYWGGERASQMALGRPAQVVAAWPMRRIRERARGLKEEEEKEEEEEEGAEAEEAAPPLLPPEPSAMAFCATCTAFLTSPATLGTMRNIQGALCSAGLHPDLFLSTHVSMNSSQPYGKGLWCSILCLSKSLSLRALS